MATERGEAVGQVSQPTPGPTGDHREVAPDDQQRLGLRALCGALRETVDRRMFAAYGGRPWRPLYEARERDRRGYPVLVDLDDPSFVLRILRTEREVFKELNATQYAWLDELIQAANVAELGATPQQREVDRVFDTMRLLAESFDLLTVVDSLRDLQAANSEPVAAAQPDEETGESVTVVESPTAGATSADATPTRVERRPTAEPPAGASVLQVCLGLLDVVAIVHESVNFALVHNGVSPIIQLTVQNNGEETAEQVTAAFDLALPEQVSPVPAAASLVIDFGTVQSGERVDARTGDLSWRLSPAPFLALDEAAAATLSLHVVVDGDEGTSGHAETMVRILPADQWWAGNSPDSLASFVRPNDAAVATVRKGASAILESTTKNPALQGYQAGAERAHRIAEAVYVAMAQQEIVYVEPPVSFEGAGQRIRSHAEVLQQRVGTCLDLACAYAAALESAGLAPVLIVTKNHAFCGYLTEDTQLPEAVITDKSAIITIVESESFEAVETTALCAGEGRQSFDQARAVVRSWWTADLGEVRALIDIRAAHRWFKPLPTIRHEGDTRVVETMVSTPAIHARRTPDGLSTSAVPRQADLETAPARVARWKRSLLDLSFVNPLLKIKERSSSALHVPAGGLGLFEDLIAAGTPVELAPHDAVAELHYLHGARTAGDVDAETLRAELEQGRKLFVAHTRAEYAKKLKALQRRAKIALEETGTDNLFAAIGSLHWTEGTKTGNAPIFLVPVILRGGRGTTPFQLAFDDTRKVEPNYCLYEKLREAFGLELPELVDPDEDNSGIDVERSLRGIRSRLLAAKALTCRVEETACLATFQFSTVDMWRDLTENWQELLARPAVTHLVEKPGQPFDDGTEEPADDDCAEASTHLPIPADGSQIRAVRWAGAGKTFILEGPPGTGKSQTITNLVAHCLATGKKVLFVAEKQAALDVVQRRLDAVGLSPFCLDVHGTRQTPRAVREQLNEALELAPEGDAGYETLLATYSSIVQRLSRYARDLHQPGPAGQSAWEARQIILQIEGSLPRELAGLTVPRELVLGEHALDDVHRLARDLDEAVEGLGTAPADTAWRLAGPHKGDDADAVHGQVHRHGVAQALRTLRAAEEAVGDPTVQRLAARMETPQQAEPLAQWLDVIGQGVGHTPGDAHSLVTDNWRHGVEQVMDAVRRHRNTLGSRLSAFAPDALEFDLDSLLARSHAIDKRLLGKKKRRQALLAELAPVNLQPVDPKMLTATLQGLIETRGAAAQVAGMVRDLPGINAPANFNMFRNPDVAAFQHQVRGWEVSAAYAASVDVNDETDELARGVLRQNRTTGKAIRDLAGAREDMAVTLGSTEADMAAWRGESTWAGAFARSVSHWQADAAADGFVRLAQWVRVRSLLERARGYGLESLAGKVLDGALAGGEIEIAVRLAVASEILAERLDTTNLVAFDPEQHRTRIKRLVESGNEVRNQLVQELPAKLVSARPFDPNARRGEIADLRSQVSGGRRRGGLSVRRLMQRFGPTIMEVTPCFLMSPASVARFLPAGSVEFDLVVFDEASQIRVPEAIGAMGRGKAVVVVGDSQQMPPSAAFAAGSMNDDEDSVDVGDELPVPADMESILTEAVASNLPRLWLSWHYRSRHESLIAFSNQQYYEDRLASFPTPPDDGEVPAVELRRVDGVWEGGSRGAARVNRAEAEAAVAEIAARLRQPSVPSIGVVTFNTQQRDLILDLLEQRAETDQLIDDALRREVEPLFVKNLENVQGDERDAVLFTLAFAADSTGRVPLNWGPLSRARGEKRLNVAVTRAKEKVVVFASFDPHALDLTNSRSKGMADLKDYLLLARDGARHALNRRSPAIDRHLTDICGRLEKSGLDVRTNIGLSDFRIDLAARAGDDAPWLAVLLDGPQWRRRESVGDRDGLPHTVLTRQMGWLAVERVWLPHWLRDADRIVENLVVATNALAEAPVPKTAAPPVTVVPKAARREHVSDPPISRGTTLDQTEIANPVVPPTPQLEPLRSQTVPVGARSANLDRHERFVAASDSARYEKAWLDSASRRATDLVRQELLDVVTTEGPIVAGRLALIVGRRFDFSRVPGARVEQILRLVPRTIAHTSANGDRVAWPPDVDPATYRSYRVPGDARDAKDVPYEELRNAMVFVVESAFRIAESELLKETASQFGWSRLGPNVRGRLEDTLRSAVRERVLLYEGDLLRLAQST